MPPVDFYERLRTLFLQCVQTITKQRPQDFSRRRKLPLARRIVVRISLVARGRDKGVATTLGECFTLARRSGLWPEGQSPHRSALSKARAKIPWQACATVLNHSVALAYEVFPPREEYLWQGLSVFAFDGSTYHLPATEAVRQWQFSQPLLNCEPTEVNMTVTAPFTMPPPPPPPPPGAR